MFIESHANGMRNINCSLFTVHCSFKFFALHAKTYSHTNVGIEVTALKTDSPAPWLSAVVSAFKVIPLAFVAKAESEVLFEMNGELK